ncbi:Hint domain-containing protein [Shimia sagamensis]|uniref:Hint domain-containing protein n=1 Tax=Shimia sagamensis TaxID=1566352 RepID=A0ABY1NT31_9RHOB|nr:Hint domain-containing protein [Shimia sagamensis]SMP17455.1 Hint domain-containing protein [Shimia sagamensis]
MARISELHYSNAYARSSGVEEFLETALAHDENPRDFVVSFYQADGSVGVEIPLSHPDVSAVIDPDTNEQVFVISASHFPVLLTDPDSHGTGNYEAYALTNTTANTVIDYYDIGGGTQNILAFDGAAAGATSENLPVAASPNSTTTSLQLNQPAPTHLTNAPVGAGDTGVACFAEGTRIRTEVGHQLIGTLCEGDLIWTRDNGLQPVRWIGCRTVPGKGKYAPVQFSPETFGALKPHQVSQNHRMFLTGWRAQLMFGEDEILVPAKALVDDCDVRICECGSITYFHLLFDDHQIVSGDGVLSESFFPGAEAMNAVDCGTQREMFALFPELATGVRVHSHTARPVAPASLGPLLMRN